LHVANKGTIKINLMKNIRFALPIITLFFAGLFVSCEKEQVVPDISSQAVSYRALTPTGVVNLLSAANFAILSKSGITDVPNSNITGNIGTSPITGAALLVTCREVSGAIYTVDAAGPLPCRLTNASFLTTAVLNMEAAYNNAAGRTNPNYLNLGAGNIGGLTLKPGLYKWTTGVIIPTNVTLSGGSRDVWIFQVAGTLNMSSAVRVTLSGGALAKNIFWQVAGATTLGTTSHFEGTILDKTGINMQTGASINGRLLAQTAVTLQKNTVVMP
jgi:hypothetical protein